MPGPTTREYVAHSPPHPGASLSFSLFPFSLSSLSLSSRSRELSAHLLSLSSRSRQASLHPARRRGRPVAGSAPHGSSAVGEAQPGGGSPRRRGGCGGPPRRRGGSGGRPRKAGGGGCGNLVAGARSRQWRRAPPGVFLFFSFSFLFFGCKIFYKTFFLNFFLV